MGVYIKGMKMPKNCLECEIRAYDANAGEEYCPFSQMECLSIGLQKNCPMAEVSEPHGRLIDADALIHELEYDIELEARCLDHFDGTHTERITSEVNKKIFETAIEILQKAPTIIEAEGE